MPLKLAFMMTITMILLFGFLFAALAIVGYYMSLPGYLVVLLAILLVFIQWFVSPYIIWWTTNMRLLEKNEYVWLQKMVKELCRKTKTPAPKIAIVNSGAPNAFVFGRTPKSAVLAVTRGLLNSLNKDEVKAVVAHEIGHINHKDMIVMTVVSVIPTVLYFIARFMIFQPREERRKSTTTAILIGALAYLIYFITNLLVLALSRLREYYADYFSATNTKPRLLVRALARITYGLSVGRESKNDHLRAFFIADPITAKKEMHSLSEEYSDFERESEELKRAMEWERKNPLVRLSEIFSTHPLTYKRIKALLELEKTTS